MITEVASVLSWTWLCALSLPHTGPLPKVEGKGGSAIHQLDRAFFPQLRQPGLENAKHPIGISPSTGVASISLPGLENPHSLPFHLHPQSKSLWPQTPRAPLPPATMQCRPTSSGRNCVRMQRARPQREAARIRRTAKHLLLRRVDECRIRRRARDDPRAVKLPPLGRREEMLRDRVQRCPGLMLPHPKLAPAISKRCADGHASSLEPIAHAKRQDVLTVFCVSLA